MTEADSATYHWIVVFGAAVRHDGAPSGVLRRRIEGAYSAWRRLPGARLLLSGAAADGRPSEAAVMRDVLLKKGVPLDVMLLDEASTDTFQQALACERLLGPRDDAWRVWVCTSAFHTPRCRLLLAMLGFRTGRVQIPRAASLRRQSKVIYWTAREVPAIVWDGFLMTLHVGRRWLIRRTQPAK